MTTDTSARAPDADRAATSALLGALIADAVAMPVHWYYDRRALDRDYGEMAGYATPRHPHPDSILWRSQWTAPAAKFDILREQAAHWGRRGVHYHQFLGAGENTLNFRLAVELFDLIRRDREYDPERWLDRYVALMLEPGWHRDTYVEEYHRHFFTNLAAGRKPINCGVRDVHIGGLAAVPALVAALGSRCPDLRRMVRMHVGLTHKDDEVLAAADAFTGMLIDVIPRPESPPRTVADAAIALREAILGHGRDWISTAKLTSWERLSDRDLVGGTLSTACYIDEAFPAALALAWRHAGDFASGVFANARCGGDNCHRGAVVGGLLGATAAIPDPLVVGLVCRGRVAASSDSAVPGKP
ncbi:MAG: ADP-ribosylglycohydrolase family protein [Planctomycetaceae bacterium]